MTLYQMILTPIILFNGLKKYNKGIFSNYLIICCSWSKFMFGYYLTIF